MYQKKYWEIYVIGSGEGCVKRRVLLCVSFDLLVNFALWNSKWVQEYLWNVFVLGSSFLGKKIKVVKCFWLAIAIVGWYRKNWNPILQASQKRTIIDIFFLLQKHLVRFNSWQKKLVVRLHKDYFEFSLMTNLSWFRKCYHLATSYYLLIFCE